MVATTTDAPKDTASAADVDFRPGSPGLPGEDDLPGRIPNTTAPI